MMDMWYQLQVPGCAWLLQFPACRCNHQDDMSGCRAVSAGKPGVVAAAQRLAQQGLSLGLVGLATGCAGSAAARQLLARRRARAEAQAPAGLPGPHVAGSGPGGSEPAGGACAVDSSSSSSVPGPQRRQQPAPVLQSGWQRAAFMAGSANVRCAALYAAEDWLPAHALGPVQLQAARLALHGVNAAIAALRWQRISQHIYAA